MIGHAATREFVTGWVSTTGEWLVFIDVAHQNTETRPCGYSCTHTHTHTQKHRQSQSSIQGQRVLTKWKIKSCISRYLGDSNLKTSNRFHYHLCPCICPLPLQFTHTHTPPKNIKLPVILYIHAHMSWTFRGYLNPGNNTNTHIHAIIWWAGGQCGGFIHRKWI